MTSNGSVDSMSNPLTYTYDPWGKRVLQDEGAAICGPFGTVYFYSVTGQLLGTYTGADSLNCPGGYPRAAITNYYFGNRLLTPVDRLGSVRNGLAYYPWGEERAPGTTDSGGFMFGTYWRDGYDPPGSNTADQDYAQARYYNNKLGRFWSADPIGRGVMRDPQTWNQYSYGVNDPVNRKDSTGLGDGPACYMWGLCFADDDGSPGASPLCVTHSTSLEYGGTFQSCVPTTAAPPGAPGWQLGSSGGGASIQQQYTALNSIQRAQAVNAISNLGSRCVNALTADHINLNQMAINASTTNFYDTYLTGNVLVSSVSGYSDPTNPQMTMSQYVQGSVAAALVNSNENIINSVMLASVYFTDVEFGDSLAESQNITLVHEELHIVTGVGDTQLAAMLGLGNNLPATAASLSISNWLSDGCAPVQ